MNISCIILLPPYALFPLGQIVATAHARDVLVIGDVVQSLARHARGDWGEVDAEDREANHAALAGSARLLSAYTDCKGTKFWIITEADRATTTVLLHEDY